MCGRSTVNNEATLITLMLRCRRVTTSLGSCRMTHSAIVVRFMGYALF